jgi:enoyl-CoA hydratase/carnithine racemase
MPTIALINGHAFGAGFFLALAHDYSIQNPSRGYMCLPEIDLGLVIPSSIVVMIKSKLPSSQLYRDAAIEGRRYTGPESLKSGIVDALGGLNEALKLIDERKLISKTASGALAGLKEDLWREVLHAFKNQQENVEWRNAIDQEKIEFQQKTEEKVAEWEKKPKL